MDKNKIKKELDEAIIKLKSICNDSHHADTLIDEILSKKGQLDVKEVELIVEKKDTIKEYDFGSFKYVRNKKGILLHSKGGYSLFVTPRMQTLHGHLSMILNWKDQYENLSESQKQTCDDVFSATFAICSIPSNSFLDDTFAFDMAAKYIAFIREHAEKLLNTPLQEEDYEKDYDFQDEVKFNEELKKQIENEKVN